MEICMENIKIENKERGTVWLYPKTFKKIDSALEMDNCKNRSEFIGKAIDFYCGYLFSEESVSYLAPILLNAIKATLKETENRHANNIFRLAVEMSMMMNILASGLEIDDYTLQKLRGNCIKTVKKSRGNISIEKVLEEQQEIEEYE